MTRYELHDCGDITVVGQPEPVGKFYDRYVALRVVRLLNQEAEHDAWLVRLKEEVDLCPDE